MAKEFKQINELELVQFYEQNEISVRNLSLKLLNLGFITFDKSKGRLNWNSFEEMVNKLKV